MEVSAFVTRALSMPTIGIGAGAGCDGQVLVWYDLIGLTPGPPLRFVKRYADARTVLADAARDYVGEVRSGAFPEEEHGWSMPEAELEGWRTRHETNGGPSSPVEPPAP